MENLLCLYIMSFVCLLIVMDEIIWIKKARTSMVKCCRCLGLSLKLLPCNCNILSGDYYIHMTNIILGIWKIINFPSSSNIGLLCKLEVSMKCLLQGMKDFKFSYIFTHSFSHSHTVFTHAELFWQNFGQSYHVWSLKECILAGILKYGVITGIWPLTRAKGPHERGSRLPIMGKGR